MLSTQHRPQQTDENRQLHQFLFWAVLTAVGAIVAYTVGWFLTAAPSLLLLTIGSIVLLILELFARWLNAHHATTAAVYLFCTAVAIFAIVNVLAVPDFLPVLLLGPVIILIVAQPYLSRKALQIVSAAMVGLAITLTSLGVYVQLYTPLPLTIRNPILIALVTLTTIVLLVLIWQNDQRIMTVLQQREASNRELQAIRERLEEAVAERTRDLQQALAQLEAQVAEQRQMRLALEQQREVIRSLSVPVLPVSHATLVMPLVGALDAQRMTMVKQQALTAIQAMQARTFIIDVTGVPVIDHTIAGDLVGIMRAIRLMGTKVVLAGIRPEVAESLVAAQIDLDRVQSFATLQDALQRAITDGQPAS